ncbi:MAG: hypothetical protein HYZ36_01530 [Pedosphaera parvula]|nr:hypothetical protein [Pedosphaera parvula]
MIGAQHDRIDGGRAEEPRQFVLRFDLPLGEGLPLAFVTRVDFDQLARLGVLQDQAAERRQLLLVAVHDLHRHDVVPAVGLAQRHRRSLRQRLREDDPPPQVRVDVRAARFGLAQEI